MVIGRAHAEGTHDQTLSSWCWAGRERPCWARRFITHYGHRDPAGMGAGEIRRFLSHLAVNQRVSASTQNQALCALVFLYGRVLGLDLGSLEGVEWAKDRGGCRWC